MLNLKLQQKLLQKLSPQQILVMKLLQIPSIALEQRIKQEIEENPALEELSNTEDEFDNNEEMEFQDNADETFDEEKTEEFNKDDEFDINDYISDDETPSYKLNSYNSSLDDERKENPFVSGTSFQEMLISQLGLRELNQKDLLIGLNIIGNLDDSGYLVRNLSAMVDDLAFTQNTKATTEEIQNVLKIIQDFDPSGIGARNLQECLLIQLKRKIETKDIDLAILIVERYFNELTKKHYDKIIKKARKQ